MKKALALILALVFFTLALTACGTKEATTTETLEPVVIDTESFVNEMVDKNPVVKVMGDDSYKLLSFDFSETATTNVEVTLNKQVKQGYLYVTMAGNVTKHSLESDGSLFDGIAPIVDGKAKFTVEYGGERVVSFTINVPA